MMTNASNQNGGMPSPRNDGGREVERRQASSTIVSEQYLGAAPPSGEVRYVEVPIIEEVIKKVPRREVVEVEKFVPKVVYDWVERVVEVPNVQYVDRVVEVEQVQEVIRHVPKPQVIDVPREVVRTVPRVVYIDVEKTVEVPGQVIEVPKPYVVENKVPVARFVDSEVPMVVAQTIKPIITAGKEAIDVDVYEYDPQVVVIDVHVPKPVPSQLIAAGLVEDVHKLVTVPAAQYNAMLKMLNSHISETDQRQALPFIMEANGNVPMLYGSEQTHSYPAPVPTAQVQGHVQGAGVIRYVQMSPGMTVNKTTTMATNNTTTTTTVTHQTSMPGPAGVQHFNPRPMTRPAPINSGVYHHVTTGSMPAPQPTPYQTASSNVSRVQSARVH